MTSTLLIKPITHGTPEYHAMVALRTKVLRTPLGLHYTPDQLAAEQHDLHYVAEWEGKTIVGCVMLARQDKETIKLRQCAVDDAFQGNNIGRLLVQHAESVAIQHHFRTIILHARATACGFYEKLGYSREGEAFIEVTLPHWKMQKTLTP